MQATRFLRKTPRSLQRAQDRKTANSVARCCGTFGDMSVAYNVAMEAGAQAMRGALERLVDRV